MPRRTKGTGSIRKRGPGVWEVRAAGAPSRTVHGSRRDAEKRLRKTLAEVDAGAHRGRGKTLSELLERRLELAAPEMSPTTVVSYRSVIDNHIEPALGTITLDKLTTADLDAFYVSLRGRLSPGTIARIHAVLSVSLRQAERWGWVVTSPARDASKPTKRPPSYDPPATSNVLALIRSVENENPELATFLWLAACSGCRRGELCALRWSKVDLTAGTIDVTRALIELAGGRTQEKDTKTHAVRTIDLDPVTVEALRRHAQRCQERAQATGGALRADGYVFSKTLDGSVPWKPQQVSAAFARVRDKLGLTFRLHDIRHYHATELAPFIDPLNLAKRLGWADAQMFFRVYGHPSRDQGKRAAAIMGDLLNADAKKPPGLPARREPEDQATDGAP